MAVLEDIPIVYGFSKEEVNELTDWLEIQASAPGQVLIKEGQESQGMYILLSGEARISKSSAEGEVTIAEVQPVSVIGEATFLTPSAATATVTASTNVETGFLSIAKFQTLIEQGHVTAYKLGLNIGRVVAKRLQVTTTKMIKAEDAARRMAHLAKQFQALMAEIAPEDSHVNV
jgi:CRP-like cAMP-binding protein